MHSIIKYIFCLWRVIFKVSALGLLLALFLFGWAKGYGQCTNHFTLKTNHICNGIDTLTVSTFDTLSQIQWFTSTTLDTTVHSVVIPSVLDVKTVAGGNGKGMRLNQFDNPYAIFIDQFGNLFVVDQNNNRILKFPPGSTSLTNGVVVAGSNTNGGSEPSELDVPMSVYVDAAGYIYVADFVNGRIQRFPPNSNSRTAAVTVAKNGIDGPSYVAMDAAGNLFVADEAGEDIVKYPPNSNAGTKCDTLGTGMGYVISLYVATNGDLYAALGDYSCVIKFPAGSKVATLVAGGNGNGNALNQLPGPTACYVDPAGYLYVMDGITCLTLKFPPNSNGSSYGTIVAGGNGVRGGSQPNSLLDPTSMFLDNAGNIYVTDDGNNRVQEYFKNGPTTTFIDSVYLIADPGPPQPGNYFAVVTNNKGCSDTTNTITILPTHLPSIGINSNALDPNLCGSFTEPLRFTASIANGGSNPIFQWHLNGNIVGSNSPTYSGIFSNKDVIDCILTSNVSCVTIPSVRSSDFIVHFHTPPSATLSLRGGTCIGKDTLSVNPDIYGISSINWMNAQNVDTVFVSHQVLDTGIASIGITVAGGNGAGNSDNQLHEPSSVCADDGGNLYVADTRNNRVLFFPKGSNSFTNGVVVAGGNGNGINADQLSAPTAVFVDAQQYLYVADANNYRIQKFAPGSTSLSNGVTVAGGNGLGSALNQFADPVSVGVDGLGNIYACDQLNNRILKFPPNSNSQTYGSVIANVANAFSMFVTSAGSVYVSDFQNNQVLLFPPGKVVENGNPGSTSTPFVPYGLFVDNQGNIFIADGRNDQVLEYTPGSSKGTVVAGGNGRGSANNQLNEPYSIYIDDSSNLFIADFGNNRIQKYKHFITVIDTVFNLKTPGAYYAVLTDTAGCTFNTDTIIVSNPVIPTVRITTPDTTICYGSPVTFSASLSDSTRPLTFLWKLNNDSVGTNSPKYLTDSIATGDSVLCIISNTDGCAAADTSNAIVLTVNPIPILGPASAITIPFGASTVLSIPVQGSVSSYSWSPNYYLSGYDAVSPIASPHRSTTYYLTVVSATDGCPTTDSIIVDVTAKIFIPNAFTPNGDGKNDIFYVMGGMPGDIIKEFAIFDRWGSKIFQNRNGIPNYTNYGWDGTIKGSPAPIGSYVYFVTIKSVSGEEAIYKGTITLIR
ncbi:MAG TPA: gliding motility-associated C-terminal domain-containing protein [Puia sp.]|nr:gliding motility-associated C-terminal domain-containing protein [Puia sp.]